MKTSIDEQIKEFKDRIKDSPAFCQHLFETATVRLLSHKYAYYVEAKPYIKDITYDIEETSWYVMGRALGYLKENETSPCIGFNETHPFAEKGKELAIKLLKLG